MEGVILPSSEKPQNSNRICIIPRLILIMFEISSFFHDFQGQREVKSEFGFDTVATEGCAKAKRKA